MTETSRRGFHRETLGSLLTFSLLETLCQSDALADSVKPVAARWLSDVNDLGRDLKDHRVKAIEWQTKVEELMTQVELPELLKLIDFERLTANVKYVDNGARRLGFKFQQIEGVPQKLVYGKQIFALKKGRSVVPHGHNNMATAFLILGGKLHGRHYDRIEDESDHLIIKPTLDRHYKPGEPSTVSDYKNNIHWFKAVTEPAFILNIHVLNLEPDWPAPTGRVYVDPAGEQLSEGLVRARRIGYREAHELYG